MPRRRNLRKKNPEGCVDRLAQVALVSDETNFRILCALLISDVLEKEQGFDKFHSFVATGGLDQSR
jgi:hypothetical protein